MKRFIVLCVVMVLALGGVSYAQDGDFTYAGVQDAPPFPEDLSWLNVPEPLTFDELQGKVVMLDFWTYGCINCIHIIPELKQLEAEYPNELVVIGVHSAKFDNEGLTENIRQVIQRYGIAHPVVNDADFQIWNRYSARAWPSVYVIDPQGKVVGRHEGEGVYDTLKPVIDTMVNEYGEAGLLDETPLQTTPIIEESAETPLSFPGAVELDPDGDRLFIADSGHNRIIVASLSDFRVQQVIGTGDPELVDGSFAEASFNAPQGMHLLDNTLYVADTNNHSIRAVDLSTQTVSTAAGTGQMSNFQLQPGPATEVDLRSPWDVVAQDSTLYIAMAGSHQLWQLDLDSSDLQPFAGNGREDLIDGSAQEAELAQPSGLASSQEWVYFTDSESSSIRRASIPDGTVETLVGPVQLEEGRLFAFGDEDGTGSDVRLQHPLGIALAGDNTLYIADTYNNKIKTIDIEERTSQTYAGSVDGGYFDGKASEARFDEPAGMDYHNGKLYIADQNNHSIRIVNLESNSVTSVVFPNVNMLLPESVAAVDNAPLVDTSGVGDVFNEDAITLPPQTVAPGEGTILVDAIMPFGYKLNDQAPFTAIWSDDSVVELPDDTLEYREVTPKLPIEFPVTLSPGETNFSVDLTIYWCESINESLCFVERGTVVMPVVVTEEAAGKVLSLSYNLTPPDLPENTFSN